MTMNKVYQKLRKNSKGQYALLSFCIFLSVVLITSFALMYFGPTVQEFLPQGGDTRKIRIAFIRSDGGGVFYFLRYMHLSCFSRFKAREYGILMALGTGKKTDITQPADERTLHFGGSILSGRVDLFDSGFIWHLENL